MNYRTVHENPPSIRSTRSDRPAGLPKWAAGQSIDTPTLLSTLWIAVLFADAFRGLHETLRPGFVDELAHEGTVYGNEVTDEILLGSGFTLAFLCAIVVLARVLPRRVNRVVNIVGAIMMISGVLASWPKDPDDLVFGTVQIVGSALAIFISVRWKQDEPIVGQP